MPADIRPQAYRAGTPHRQRTTGHETARETIRETTRETPGRTRQAPRQGPHPRHAAGRPRTPRTPRTRPAPHALYTPYVPFAPYAPGAAPARTASRRPPWVLMYHSVSDLAGPVNDPYRITVTPVRLEGQLRWLRDRGLTGVSVGELLRARAAGRGGGLVGLTFDDGYADFAETAVPLLRRYECTATAFVLPGRLGGSNAWDELGPRKPLLDADGIRAAAQAGMEIGSHGLLHTDLTAADDAALERETAASRALLADLTGTTPAGFCYPYGTVDARAVGAVRAAGYAYACAIDPGELTGVHALPRVHIGDEDTPVRMFLKRALHPLRRRPLPRHPVSYPEPSSRTEPEPSGTGPSAETEPEPEPAYRRGVDRPSGGPR